MVQDISSTFRRKNSCFTHSSRGIDCTILKHASTRRTQLRLKGCYALDRLGLRWGLLFELNNHFLTVRLGKLHFILCGLPNQQLLPQNRSYRHLGSILMLRHFLRSGQILWEFSKRDLFPFLRWIWHGLQHRDKTLRPGVRDPPPLANWGPMAYQIRPHPAPRSATLRSVQKQNIMGNRSVGPSPGLIKSAQLPQRT